MKIRLIIFSLAMGLWGCRKDNINTDPAAMLEFSTDSILFDTVFTSVGSTTQRVKVFNRGKRAVNISEIKLAGGASSNYQININGVAGHALPDVLLDGNDSLNVFIKVTIDPSAAQLPFIVKDSIEFRTNGNYQKVILSAFGQNAVFLKEAKIATNTTWDKSLPYVIFNSVLVEPGVTLTIQKGSRIYFHKDAVLRIAGTLKVLGDRLDTIRFSSDRLERIYKDEAGQWHGLHFLKSSKDNHIDYAIIRNGAIGIRVDSLSQNANPKLLLTNTIINNMALVALYCDNADVAGFNNLMLNAGRHLIYAINGGKYDFKQNSLVNIGFQFPRTSPSVFFANHFNSSASREMDLTLVNNIIWGNLQDELLVEKQGTLAFRQVIRKNLIRSRVSGLGAEGNILNADPLFKNTKKNDFTLLPTSPAANMGEDLTADLHFNSWLSNDLNGTSRLFPSDLGSYEVL